MVGTWIKEFIKINYSGDRYMKKGTYIRFSLIFAVALVGCNNGEATDETIGIREK